MELIYFSVKEKLTEKKKNLVAVATNH